MTATEDYDVVVVGGGAGGVGAALGATQAGARTLLLESAGFLGGAGVRDAAALAGAAADSGALHHALDSLYTAGALRFAYGEMVYATQLDEFYWWENHVPVPLYIGLRELNEKMRKGQEQ